MCGAFEVGTVEVPAQGVIAGKRPTSADEPPAWIGASPGRLEEAASACGAAGPGVRRGVPVR